MTNHPRRAMKSRVLHDTLVCPNSLYRAWTWESEVVLGDRRFTVKQRSMTGAFEGDTASALVESYLDGTLHTQVVREI